MTEHFTFRGAPIHFLQLSELSPCKDGRSAEAVWEHSGREAIRRDLTHLGDGALRRLRVVLLESGASGLHYFSDDEVLDQMAARIERGTIRVVKCPGEWEVVSGGGSPAEAVQEAPAASDESSMPVRRAGSSQKSDTTWIEVRLIDSAGNPVASKAYQLKLPDGRTVEGHLDSDGAARVSGIDPGMCQLCFTELDAGEWEPA